ncbi:AI-2E family transporter [Jonesia quinghaiensis]|uniref:AI-2E family transporter n=1 Tax=Jonesia quinghaiensis TaxID=262806 RepID=UPI00042917F7|nr:AI-2E family transporter [Jonesia quinghaiensis]
MDLKRISAFTSRMVDASKRLAFASPTEREKASELGLSLDEAPTPRDPDDYLASSKFDNEYTGDWFTSPRPPRWFMKALWITVITIFVAIFLWRAMGSLTGLIINLVIALFLSLALEPMIIWFVRRGWKRGAATAVTIFGALVTAIVVVAVFGRMFIDQATQLIKTLPDMYDSIALWIERRTEYDVPEMSQLQKQLIDQIGSAEAANQALAIGAGLVSFLFNLSVVLLVAYYLCAAGPRFRASICAWLSPAHQTEVLRLWDITQRKIADYINSRFLLAAICSFFTAIFLQIIDVPYALPLAVFTGVVSQFVPTIGTYIGGALPIVFALTTGSLTDAVAILIFIVAYQQIENLWLSPKISARALELNPAVALIVVLGFGAVFGALGAFLALPVAATITAIASTYLRRHELIDSEMLRDPRGVGRSSTSSPEKDSEPLEGSEDSDPAGTESR